MVLLAARVPSLLSDVGREGQGLRSDAQVHNSESNRPAGAAIRRVTVKTPRWLARMSLGPGSAVGAWPSAPVVGSRDFWSVSLATQPTLPSSTRGAGSDEVMIHCS